MFQRRINVPVKDMIILHSIKSVAFNDTGDFNIMKTDGLYLIWIRGPEWRWDLAAYSSDINLYFL